MMLSTTSSKRPRPCRFTRSFPASTLSRFMLLPVIVLYVAGYTFASKLVSSPSKAARGVRGRSNSFLARYPQLIQPDQRVLKGTRSNSEDTPSFSGDSSPYHSGKRITSESEHSKKMKSSKMKSSKRGSSVVNSNNVFDHGEDVLHIDGSNSGSYHDDSSGDIALNSERPNKIPMQPVFCAKEEPVVSALLVRMVGNPSLMTRYERHTVERVVRDSYNDWMKDTCDRYHRMVDRVTLKPITDLPKVSKVHEDTLKMERGQIESEESSDDIPRRLVQAEDIYDDQDQDQLTNTFEDSEIRYRPLYWLSISGTCRNCPKTFDGNSNLLASHAGRVASGMTISTDPLILEEICFCTLRKANTTHTGGNETKQAYATEDEFFLEAQAPTSLDLLGMINQKVEELRSLGILAHVEALVQLTEPDYAYYALEMEGPTPIDITQTQDTLRPSLASTRSPVPNSQVNETSSLGVLPGSVVSTEMPLNSSPEQLAQPFQVSSLTETKPPISSSSRISSFCSFLLLFVVLIEH